MRHQQVKTLGLSVTANLITGSLTQSSRGSYPDPSIGACDSLSGTVTLNQGPEDSWKDTKTDYKLCAHKGQKVMETKGNKFFKQVLIC